MERLFAFGFLAPPTVLIVLCLIGAAVAPWWRRAGIALALSSSVGLYLAAMPVVSSYLLYRVETELPAQVDFVGAEAIVVLGGDVQHGNGRDMPDRLGLLSLERVMLAAQAYRRMRLPVAVSGGRVDSAYQTEGELMKTALERDFGVPVRWNEDRSRTTWQNALFTARLLQREQLRTVIVVSQAWHLPRALWSFGRVGIKALPWPAPRVVPHYRRIGSFLPNIAALHDTFYALHELIGGLYYRLRY